MDSFSSGSSWECMKWFQTFSERFPQYTSPGIWIAAQERLHGLKSRSLQWDRTSRTLRLPLTNSRGRSYTLAMHFYPGAPASSERILQAAESIPGLVACLAAGDLPPALLDAIKASGENVFLAEPGEIQFDPGMMGSECALLIAAFLEELEQEPGRWFRFIGLDFASGAKKLVAAPAGGDGACPTPACEAAPHGEQMPRSSTFERSLDFIYARDAEVLLDAASPLSELAVPELGEEAALARLRLWQPGEIPSIGTSLIEALPAAGLSPARASRSWCAFGDTEAREFLLSLIRAAAHGANEALGTLERREARQAKTPAMSVNPKWRKFLEGGAEVFNAEEHCALGLDGTVLPTRRIEHAIMRPAPDGDPGKERRIVVDTEDFLFAVLALTRRELLPLKPGFAFWHAVAMTAARLVAACAVIPVPVPGAAVAGVPAEEGFQVLWVPAVSAPGVAQLLCECAAVTKELPESASGRVRKGFAASSPERAHLEGVFGLITLTATALVHSASERNREVSRRLIGRRVRRILTGEGFLPDMESQADLSSVVAGFLAIPLAAVTLPCRIVVTGELAKGALKLVLGLAPRFGAGSGSDEAPMSLAQWEASGRDPEQRMRRGLELLAESHPLFSEFGKSFDAEGWLPRSQWEFFLFSARPALEAFGISFRLPESMSRIEKPRIVLTVTQGAEEARPRRGGRLATQGMLSAAALADFRWEIAVGDERLTLEELRERINAEGELLTSGGALFHLSAADLDKLVREWMDAQKKALSNWEKLSALLSGQLSGRTVEATEELLAKIRESAVVKELPPPLGLEATLRPYQVRGYSWLVQNALLGFGSLLADDMGLGKTVQVIAAVQELKNRGELRSGRVLIAAPASLLVNWQREINRFAPQLTTQIFHGKDRDIGSGDTRPDILITSYGILKRELAKLSGERFRLLVLDEAQAVKNSRTGQARAAQEFPADAVIALTGTPVENRLSEYWSIFSIVEPGLLGSAAQFRHEFVDPIEERRDRGAIDRFRRITAPFLLRRVKTDPGILDELPEKNVVDYFTTLTPKQVALYEACLKGNLETLETIGADAEQLDSRGRAANAAQLRMSRRGQILRMILHLKQISNSPSQFEKNRSEKPDSGKAEALMELLARCRESGRKALIFTQFREMGERLVEWIEAETGKRPEFLHGGVPANKRMEMVDAFQNDPDADVFVLSLKAGGTGLNLTAASAVIHYDLWWNPAVEDQASDRAWRIGQRRDVVVYRFITAGTFEEKVNEMLKKKRELADLAVGVGESWIGDLTDEEIRDLFTLSRPA